MPGVSSVFSDCVAVWRPSKVDQYDPTWREFETVWLKSAMRPSNFVTRTLFRFADMLPSGSPEKAWITRKASRFRSVVDRARSLAKATRHFLEP